MHGQALAASMNQKLAVCFSQQHLLAGDSPRNRVTVAPERDISVAADCARFLRGIGKGGSSRQRKQVRLFLLPSREQVLVRGSMNALIGYLRVQARLRQTHVLICERRSARLLASLPHRKFLRT